MIGAIILVSGSVSGLYIAAVALVTNTCYMITEKGTYMPTKMNDDEAAVLEASGK
jgi:hypothetical protein